MKRSTKIISIILIFFLIIATVIIGRTMIGNHFKKKFGKRQPPGIIITEVVKKEFSEKIETFGTAISNKSETFKIKKDDLVGDLELKNYVKKGEILIKLKSGNILAPFSGVLGYTGLTEDIFVSNNIFIITLDDNSTIYSDIKIPENYSASIKKGLPVEVKISSYKNKIFKGEVDFVSSRINADTRSLLSRIKVENKNLELISTGSSIPLIGSRTRAPSALMSSTSSGRHTMFTECSESANFAPNSEPYDAPIINMLYVVINSLLFLL